MPFEHIFNDMEITADPFALCELQGRCDLGLGLQSFCTLHYVLAGEGEIVLKDRPPILVSKGALVLVPSQKSHILRSFGKGGTPVPHCKPAELDLVTHIAGNGHDQDNQRLLAICSRIKVGLRQTSGLVELIRTPLVAMDTGDGVLSGPVDALLRELANPRLGGRAMIRALLLQCLIDLLRDRLEAGDGALDWMAALKDERLWGALKIMLDTPGDPHSLESLSDHVGMSRSTFAKRFSDAYGSGPMELLRGVRMNMAATMLLQSDLPVKRIAQLVGFQSRSAFTRTFEAGLGVSPRAYRARAETR